MTTKVPGAKSTGRRGAGAAAKAVPLTFEEAQKRFTEARTAYQEATEGKYKAAESKRVLEREMQAAAKAQDYERAATLKKERDALSVPSNDDLRALAEVVQAANASVTELFFSEHGHLHAPSTIKVSRVLVVNPETLNSDEEVYTDSSDTIQLNVDGKHFESEAYHVGEWAVQHGFLTKYFSAEIKV